MSALELRIKCVAERVTQQVERKADQNDRDCGEDQLPRIGLHTGTRGIGQRAEGRHRKGNTKSDEGQIRFCENRCRNFLCGADDDDGQAVRQNVLADDPASLSDYENIR